MHTWFASQTKKDIYINGQQNGIKMEQLWIVFARSSIPRLYLKGRFMGEDNNVSRNGHRTGWVGRLKTSLCKGNYGKIHL
jgi:hypothetical protein